MTVDTPTGASTETVALAENATAFTALNASHTVTYREYTNGYFITGIDGLQQNETHSWMYFVNGEVPSTAANRYVLAENDSITFRYMSNDAAADLVS
ncbi:MAG: DUF4430 domain-containing protein [Candidatus Nanohaloarchaea archaeon]|nr:DUF4430 domain-containing protein [Candidatus Nanohaloarchaea archaeon]